MKTQTEHIEAMRAAVKRFEGLKWRVCFWCDVACMTTRDHVVPLGAGGKNHWENVVPACTVCQGERSRIMSLHKDAKKLKETEKEFRDSPSFKKSVVKQQMTQRALRPLLLKWFAIETERWGWSPSASLDLGLPIMNWYEQIEEGIRDVVKILRDNGFNTTCSCHHDMEVMVNMFHDGEMMRLHNTLYNSGFANYALQWCMNVEDGKIIGEWCSVRITDRQPVPRNET